MTSPAISRFCAMAHRATAGNSTRSPADSEAKMGEGRFAYPGWGGFSGFVWRPFDSLRALRTCPFDSLRSLRTGRRARVVAPCGAVLFFLARWVRFAHFEWWRGLAWETPGSHEAK